MRITQSQVSLSAERQFSAEQSSSTLRLQSAPAPSTEVTLSPAAHQPRSFNNMDQRVSLIKSLLESILGYEIKFWGFDGELTPPETPSSSPQAESAGFSLETKYTYAETENAQFQAKGKVKTAAGMEIQFSAELSLSRSYQFSSQTEIYSGSMARPKKDPLILNYATAAATLSDQKFSFDLSSDGRPQEISLLRQGSAFLALDRNEDGKINQGSELFGAQSGDGFADLAQYDNDQNGWIDEGDAVFAHLKLWIKDDSGQDQLVPLSDKGIGALFLGHAQARFNLNNSSNETLGQIRASGIYLREDGSGGSMQQIDLAV
ncbi:hypothetical protein HA050_18605 [Iodobacter sp. HSC-16F04]|uniref:VCBS repeat-containing protein n=1 Tax=Iodobacter violaceini TaxID=3044271 RepID=A0ABX0KTZ6_9NEIS|nr:hypothetical protein [Iodobacter violacea]NHQ88121.1 hypothetical protein [Iodobacter violacea]